MNYQELSRRKTSPGRRIKQLLRESGMTQEELADRLNVSVQAISAWVTDKSLPVRNKNELAKLFGVDVDYLLCKQAERKKQEQDFSSFELNKDELVKIRNHSDMYKAVTKLLNLQGYDLIEGQAVIDPNSETIKYMEGDYVVTGTIGITEGINTYKVCYPDGTILEISGDRLDSSMKSIMDYIGFTMQQLKDNNSSGS